MSGEERGSRDETLGKLGYTLGETLGRGAFGLVRVAWYDNGRNRVKLACKITDADRCSERFMRKFFPRELECCCYMRHPNVVRTHSVLRRRNEIFVFMQFVPNGNCLAYLAKNGKLSEYKAHYWFRQVISGLQYMHDKRWVHRDMKVDNILLTKSWNCKLADFGFARTLESETQSETYCGSPAYSHPRILARKPYDPALADVWSCGVILFVFLEGSLPFRGRGNARVLHRKMMNRDYEHKADVTDSVKDLISKLLQPVHEKQLDLNGCIRHPWMSSENYRSLCKREGFHDSDAIPPMPRFDVPRLKESRDVAKVASNLRPSTGSAHPTSAYRVSAHPVPQ
ncbi:unnamed protein product [Darwinula stevensoni]|uniref:Protein kinase domain-containing protein n=1 Tax=Darwinula stevensoni TaxID=69355 RepID=A0A7R8XDA0_9CRUS|nr:unnamed protein product [Darwinula stevensoni]CAG0893023.1 unnamed protein product [Darwinula stevensoni]